MRAELREILGEDDNATFDIEKGTCLVFRVEAPREVWSAYGSEQQTFPEALKPLGLDRDEGYILNEDSEKVRLDDKIGLLVKPGIVEDLQ
jgi:hypothetical protein